MSLALFAVPVVLAGCGEGQGVGAGVDDATGRINHTLYIHGRSTSGTPGDWSYWRKKEPGPDPIAVNWDGRDCIGNQNVAIVSALDRYCTQSNWCYVMCHSAGCVQIEYALSKHGGTADGKNRWNVYWVMAAGSAEGGSELADVGQWTTGYCIDRDLTTTAARSLYDHNNTRGVPIFMHAGSGGKVQSFVLPGQDDGVVAYHSAGGARTTGSFVNDGGFLGTPLRSAPLFSNRVLEFIDQSEQYSHSIDDGPRGIVSVAETSVLRKQK